MGRKLPLGEAACNRVFVAYELGAKRRGHSLNLTIDDFKSLTKQNCYYCGIEPRQIYNNNGLYSDYIYNSIDRVDDSRGYELDNLVPCCKFCNLAKRGMTSKEFYTWIERVYKYTRV